MKFFLLGSVIAVTSASAAFLIYRCWWKRRAKNKLPKKWRKVGTLTDLVCFPVKSLGPIRRDSLECTILGLKSDWLRDRTLMVTDNDGKFITAREMPKMVQILPSITGSVLTLHSKGKKSCSIDLAKLGKNRNLLFVKIWEQNVSAYDCGDEVAKWLSKILLRKNKGLRLVYYPLQQPVRTVRNFNIGFSKIENCDTGAFCDNTTYSLQNQASIDDLNERLGDELTPLQFRANFLIEGPKPLEEDFWDFVKMGDVIFRSIKPCVRCILPTVNPETGEKHKLAEPLITLRKYRLITDQKFKKFAPDSPVMGLLLGLRGEPGTVHVGDAVYVGDDEKMSDESIKIG